MRIEIKVIPRASRVTIDKNTAPWKVYVRESAADGKANDAVIRLLSKAYAIAPSHIRIIRGATSRYKVIDIPCVDQ